MREATYNEACQCWPDEKNPLFFAGWKETAHRAVICWNGGIVVDLPLWVFGDEKAFSHRRNDFMHLSFGAGIHPEFPDRTEDTGVFKVGLEDGPAPIAVIRRSHEAFEMRQTVFALLPDGWELKSDDDPIFIWSRFEIIPHEGKTVPEDLSLWIQIADANLHMHMRPPNVTIPEIPLPYRKGLHFDGERLLDETENVRLAVVEKLDGVSFRTEWEDKESLGSTIPEGMNRNLLRVPISPRQPVTLLIPTVPEEPDVVWEVSQIGYDRAKEYVRGFWLTETGKGARIETPEMEVNEAFRWNLYQIALCSTRSILFDTHVLRTGSHLYEGCWTTPNCMTIHELDLRGRHKEAAELLEMYLAAQGQNPPPGDCFVSSEGYFSASPEWTPYPYKWISDHGAVMWAAAEHYLLSRDVNFLFKWLSPLLSACNWIKTQREFTKRLDRDKKPVVGYGLIPRGRATDDHELGLFVWSDAWIYRGLSSVVRLLHTIRSMSLPTWEAELEDYRECFRKAMTDAVSRAGTWDLNGEAVPYVPYELGKAQGDSVHPFSLDTGSLVLGALGLVPADSQWMTDCLRWFTEGPHIQEWADDREPFIWQKPCLPHEMSSCEPCYSWNVDLRFLRDEVGLFLEGFYSLAAGARSRRFLSGVETRHGVFGLPCPGSVLNRHLRNMIVYENGDVLEYLRAVPKAWIAGKNKLAATGLPTYFGETSIEVHSDLPEGDLRIAIAPPAREAPRFTRVRLRRYLEEIREIRIGDEAGQLDAEGWLNIPLDRGRVEIIIKGR